MIKGSSDYSAIEWTHTYLFLKPVAACLLSLTKKCVYFWNHIIAFRLNEHPYLLDYFENFSANVPGIFCTFTAAVKISQVMKIELRLTTFLMKAETGLFNQRNWGSSHFD